MRHSGCTLPDNATALDIGNRNVIKSHVCSTTTSLPHTTLNAYHGIKSTTHIKSQRYLHFPNSQAASALSTVRLFTISWLSVAACRHRLLHGFTIITRSSAPNAVVAPERTRDLHTYTKSLHSREHFNCRRCVTIRRATRGSGAEHCERGR